MLLIFLTTVYTIGTELKEKTSKELMQLADNSIVTALVGKLIPQTVTFFIMATFYNVYLYGFLHYPCHSGIFPMLLADCCWCLPHKHSVYSFSDCSVHSVWH